MPNQQQRLLFISLSSLEACALLESRERERAKKGGRKSTTKCGVQRESQEVGAAGPKISLLKAATKPAFANLKPQAPSSTHKRDEHHEDDVDVRLV